MGEGHYCGCSSRLWGRACVKHHAASLHNQHSSMHIPAVSEDERAGQREGFFLCIWSLLIYECLCQAQSEGKYVCRNSWVQVWCIVV